MHTKFCGNVANLIWNALYRQEMQTQSKDGGCRHIDFRRDVAISLLLNRFSPNLLLTSNSGLLVEKRQKIMLKTILV